MNSYKIIFEDSRKFSIVVESNDEFAAEKLAKAKIEAGDYNVTEHLSHTCTILNTQKV